MDRTPPARNRGKHALRAAFVPGCRASHARIDALIEEIDFDLRATATYGRVRAQLEAGGAPIGPNDMLIAAHALSRRLTLVTDNTAEFKRVKGLKVENWRE